MRVTLLVTAVVLTLSLTGGCRSLEKAVTKKVLEKGTTKPLRMHYRNNMEYTLTSEDLRAEPFEGTIVSGRVIVDYQRGLQSQARCVADETNSIFAEVERQLGMEIVVDSHVYLLRVDRLSTNLNIRLEAAEPNELPIPLLAAVGEDSCKTILESNLIFPGVWMHEAIEMSLILPGDGPVVLGDLHSELFGLSLHLRNETRWFRDGLANYAGYLARRVAVEQRDLDIADRSGILNRDSDVGPFSGLDRIGEKLFSWHQSVGGENARVYYNAALGLFLLIEDRFGQEAIRGMIARIADGEPVDGTDLIRIANETLGTDIRKLIDDFCFPELGLTLKRLTQAAALNRGYEVEQGLRVEAVEPNSAAALAGIEPNDVLIDLAGRRVNDVPRFELALFSVRNNRHVEATLWRSEAGLIEVKLDLDLARAAADARQPGSRREPRPHHHQIEYRGTIGY